MAGRGGGHRADNGWGEWGGYMAVSLRYSHESIWFFFLQIIRRRKNGSWKNNSTKIQQTMRNNKNVKVISFMEFRSLSMDILVN